MNAIFLQILFWGLYAGCIYILLATGLTLIFGVMKIVNFAHGELLMLGAYTTYWVVTFFNLNPYLAILISMLLLALLGIAIQRLCFQPIYGTGKLNEIFLSMGLIYLLQNTVAYVCGDDWRSIQSPYQGRSIPLGSMNLPFDYLIIIIVTIVVLFGLYLFLKTTSIGRAIRATSENRIGAVLVGVNVKKMDMLTFALGSSLAAAAGTLWAVSGQLFNPYMGSIPAIKAFAIIILGGLGSMSGAIVGGLLYGIAENMAAYFLGGAWKDAIAFIILILVLVIKPEGIFGEEEVVK